MTKTKQNSYVKGSAKHRRTQNDYMGTLLDAVSLDDWKEVVTNTLQAAKNGDSSARAWLAQYLVGKPDGKAPTPMNVVVQQWSGKDPVASKLAKPIIERTQYPMLHGDDDWKDALQAEIAAELANKTAVGCAADED